ncbi:hypothetical protein PIB30_063983 [Stylosanthes scabra]|uniref:F-box domain-containing protein n=1 Tax=Stylosanthes scabra TaxID=79078 RepID=A0ABU6RLY1_9FABA|nr:hypothetical protein [Stylosanthes scabra]
MRVRRQKSINEILPLELIQRILLRVLVNQLARLRCVSKLWYSQISDPRFAESHLHHSPAPTNVCLFQRQPTESHFVNLEEVFNENKFPLKAVSFPFKKNPPSDFHVMGTCRGSLSYPVMLLDAGTSFGSPILASETLLIFDLKERNFSKISLLEQLVMRDSPNLAVLGGCLAFYPRDYGKQKTDIWVMKEYKVQSSWTLYEIPGGHFNLMPIQR